MNSVWSGEKDKEMISLASFCNEEIAKTLFKYNFDVDGSYEK
jgi:hypothetical protein